MGFRWSEVRILSPRPVFFRTRRFPGRLSLSGATRHIRRPAFGPAETIFHDMKLPAKADIVGTNPLAPTARRPWAPANRCRARGARRSRPSARRGKCAHLLANFIIGGSIAEGGRRGPGPAEAREMGLRRRTTDADAKALPVHFQSAQPPAEVAPNRCESCGLPALNKIILVRTLQSGCRTQRARARPVRS